MNPEANKREFKNNENSIFFYFQFTLFESEELLLVPFASLASIKLYLNVNIFN